MKTSELGSISEQFYIAAALPKLIYLDGEAAVIAMWAWGGENLFEDREHVTMFFLLLSEIMK